MKTIISVVLVILFTGAAFGADIRTDLQGSDSNRDGVLNHSELVDYFLQHDNKVAELRKQGMGDANLKAYAGDLADDALSMRGEDKPALSIDDAFFMWSAKQLLPLRRKTWRSGGPASVFLVP